MLNKYLGLGRLVKDPVLRKTQEGTSVTSFNIAVNSDFVKDNGEREVDFLPVVVWKKQAENCCQYLKKGSLVMVEGRLKSRSYEGQDGKRVYVVEIVAEKVTFMDPPPSNQQDNQSTSNSGNQNNNQRDEDPFINSGTVIDEELPPWLK